jgi:hypothetical protein
VSTSAFYVSPLRVSVSVRRLRDHCQGPWLRLVARVSCNRRILVTAGHRETQMIQTTRLIPVSTHCTPMEYEAAYRARGFTVRDVRQRLLECKILLVYRDKRSDDGRSISHAPCGTTVPRMTTCIGMPRGSVRQGLCVFALSDDGNAHLNRRRSQSPSEVGQLATV